MAGSCCCTFSLYEVSIDDEKLLQKAQGVALPLCHVIKTSQFSAGYHWNRSPLDAFDIAASFVNPSAFLSFVLLLQMLIKQGILEKHNRKTSQQKQVVLVS